MSDPDIHSAAKALREFPGLPFEDVSQRSAYQFYEREEHAEHLVELAADFVAALDAADGGEKLRRRFVRFRNDTDPGSRYRRFLKVAHDRIVQAWQASPDKDAGSMRVSQLTALDRPERFAEFAVSRRDVDRFLGFGESILWHPYELKRYCTWLWEFLGHEEVILLGHELQHVITRMETDRLWGSFLLDVAHDVAHSPEPNGYLSTNLKTTITHAQGAVAAIKDAADGLVSTLPVDEAQAVAENSDAAPAILPVAPPQSVPSGQPNPQETPTAAPVVGSEADKGSPTATEKSVAQPGAETKDNVSEAAEMVGSFPQNAERKAPKSPAACYHSPDEDPPEPYRNNGPIEGTKLFLASLLPAGNNADRRSLDSWVRDGLLWGQRIKYRHYRIWFLQHRDFLAAKETADDNRRRGQEES
jgi:hypothetical protein